MTNTYTSGLTDTYTPQYDKAGQVLIMALLKKGYTVITLDYLYDTLGADTKETKNGVRWAVRTAKNFGIITKTAVKGVYQVA